MWVVAAANKNLRQSRQRVFEQLGAFLTSNSYSQPAVSDLFHSPSKTAIDARSMYLI
jgi:hypothetical protein